MVDITGSDHNVYVLQLVINMKHLMLLILIVGTFFMEVGAQTKKGFLPIVDAVIAVIPDRSCPVRIDDVIAVPSETGGINILYRVTNTGDREIKGYTVMTWFDDDVGSINTGEMPRHQSSLKPGVSAGLLVPNWTSQFKDTNSHVKSPDGHQIVFVAISEILFADGTSYSASENMKLFKAWLNSIEVHRKKE